MQNHKMRRTCANGKSTGLKLARVDVRQELHLIIIWFMQIRRLVTSQYAHKMMQNHKMRRTCANGKFSGLKLARVDVRQKLHLMIVVMMSPWQHTHYQTSTFLKWIMPYLLLQRLTDFLVHVLCNDHICIALSEWKSKANNSSWKRGTLTLPFWCLGPGAHCFAMEMSQRTSHGICDECNNCTRFQFYT